MAVAVILGSCSSLMYSGNTAAAKLPDSNWGAIDRTGKLVIAPTSPTPIRPNAPPAALRGRE